MTLSCGHLVEVAQGIGTQNSRLFLHDASALSSTHINSAAPAHAPLISLLLLPASVYCFESNSGYGGCHSLDTCGWSFQQVNLNDRNVTAWYCTVCNQKKAT